MDIFHPGVPSTSLSGDEESFLFNTVAPFPSRILSLAGSNGGRGQVVPQQQQLPINVLQQGPAPTLDLSLASPHSEAPRLTFTPPDEADRQRPLTKIENGRPKTRLPGSKKNKAGGISTASVEKLRLEDEGIKGEAVFLSQAARDEDGKFVSQTKVINNAPFPQIVIIPQKQGEAQGDEFHINVGNSDGDSNDSLDLSSSGAGKNSKEVGAGDDSEDTQQPRKQRKQEQLVAQRDQLKVQQEQLTAQLAQSMQESPRIQELEQLIRRQERLLAKLEAERATDRPDDQLTEQRISELEAASAKQAEILQSLGEAVEDVNVESANTATRLTVLETIASRQKKE